jgi:tetratricopeptide (TPR) repeat protein
LKRLINLPLLYEVDVPEKILSKRDMQNKKNVLFRVNHLLRWVLIAMCWTGIYAAAAQETPACEAGVDYFAQAQLLNERKSTEKAIEAYTCAIQANPQFVNLYLGRGWSYLTLFQYEKAIADFEIAEGLTPYWQTQYYMGKAYAGLNRHEEAIAFYDRALAGQPDYIYVLIDRGVSYVTLKEYELAIADFTYFLSLPSDAPDDTYAYVYLNKGNLYMLTGRELEAAIDFLEYIAWAGLSSIDAGTLTIGQREKVTMGGNDLLRFTFEAQAGEQYKLSAIPDNPDIRIDTLLLVISPDGSPLIANDDFNPETDSSAIIPVFEALEDGLYTVVVTHGRHPDQGVIQVLVQAVPEIHSEP